MKAISCPHTFKRKQWKQGDCPYCVQEAGPQLLMQAFLQRILNGGGQIDWEYGLGRGRTDLYLRWPWGADEIQRVVIELKILHYSLDRTIAQGMEQVYAYTDRSGAEDSSLRSE